MVKQYKTRFYNQLVFSNKEVKKISDSARIDREYAWFEAASKVIPQNIPTVNGRKYLDDGRAELLLERLKGDNLFENVNKAARLDLVWAYLSKISDIFDIFAAHKSETNNVNQDVKEMYFEKPKKALNFYYKKYGHLQSDQDLVINGRRNRRPENLLEELFTRLSNQLSNTSYCFTHGDPTLTNMIDVEGRVVLIDPRGAFGSTEIYGDPRYDIAKVYFSVVGAFDAYNHHRFKISKSHDVKFDYLIESKLKVNELDTIFRQIFINSAEEDVLIKYIHATIWLSLFPHLEETEDHTLVAYLHGTKLINQVAKEIENSLL
jgi:hypothetical protein